LETLDAAEVLTTWRLWVPARSGWQPSRRFTLGKALLEEFLKPSSVTQHRLAVSLGVPSRRIKEIVHGKRRVTADTALRLARYFGTTDRFWLNLQTSTHFG